MLEFGSDYHLILDYHSHRAHLTNVYHDALLMADGRQCIIELIRQYGWNRLWIPEYYCHETIKSVRRQTGIEICYYADYPLADDNIIVSELQFKDGDVLLRVNYFGLRDFRSNKNILVPVIEDHTHDLLGRWALYSDADWCIASLRKSLPLPEGGMLWSPKGHLLFRMVRHSDENNKIAEIRWDAMEKKADYLKGNYQNKEIFRKKFVETEKWFDNASPSLLDERSRVYIDNFDINAWQVAKRRNWQIMRQLISFDTLLPEGDSCTSFSFILLAENPASRTRIRKNLIDNSVYPAILWDVPEKVDAETKDFSLRMLSIHCDGRYTEDEIRQLADIINKSL